MRKVAERMLPIISIMFVMVMLVKTALIAMLARLVIPVLRLI